MTEVWRPVVGFENLYEVSDLGRVRCHPTARGKGRTAGAILKPSKGGTRGYPIIHLRRPGAKAVTSYVYTLVLEAFVGPRPPGYEACHDPDPTPTNCQLSNLRWDTQRANIKDKLKHGTQTRGSAHPTARLTEQDIRDVFQMKSAGHRNKDIAKAKGISETHVSQIVRRTRWGHLAWEQAERVGA